MTSFNVRGWFGIEYEKRKGGRTLVFDNFWSEGSKANHLADERGCYVFAVKTGRGLEPIYVGKATKTFKQETFNPANKHKYHDGFSEYAKGLPLMFFVVHPDQKARQTKSRSKRSNSSSFRLVLLRTPDFKMYEGRTAPNGVFVGLFAAAGKGKRTKAEGAFRRVFDLAD